MRVGILGSGLMGGNVGTIFARAGDDMVFSYARSRSKLENHRQEQEKRKAALGPEYEDNDLICCRDDSHLQRSRRHTAIC